MTRPRMLGGAEDESTLNEIEKTAATTPLTSDAMISKRIRLQVQVRDRPENDLKRSSQQ